MKLLIALSAVAAASSVCLSMAHAETFEEGGKNDGARIQALDGNPTLRTADKGIPGLDATAKDAAKLVDEGNPDPTGKPGERRIKPGATSFGTAKRDDGKCVDKDKDGDPSVTDCDDNDPKRHHATSGGIANPGGQGGGDANKANTYVKCEPGDVDPAQRKSGAINSGDFNRRDVRSTVGWREQGSQGIGLGVSTGNATDGSANAVPKTLQLEYFNVGKNPTQKGSGYGLTVDKLEFSGVTNGLPEMAIETRGMSGWQIIGAGDKHPVMFHLGLEPTNFEGQLTSHIVGDARNTAARIAQSKLDQNGVAGTPQGQQGISSIGNPDGPVNRNQFMYYVPAVSMGVEVRKLGCRFLGLARGGAAGGGQLRTDKNYSYGVSAAYGLGAYVNCPQFDVVGEWTRIAQSDAPMDLLNADVMIKPFKNIPLAVGAELGSTVVNAQDPKSVPLAFPGYSVKGANVETHAGATVRVVF